MADDGQKMWGGRFSGKPDALMTRINASIAFDKRLWREDIAASKAHAAMLRDQKIISAEDAAAILAGLDTIATEYERDGVPENAEFEDIHMTVESRLAELIGPAADGCTPVARATTRSRRISGCGSVPHATKPRTPSVLCSGRS